MGAYHADEAGSAKDTFLIINGFSWFLWVFLSRPGGLLFAALSIITYLVDQVLELLPNIRWRAGCLSLVGFMLISFGLRISKRVKHSSTNAVADL